MRTMFAMGDNDFRLKNGNNEIGSCDLAFDHEEIIKDIYKNQMI